MMTFSLDVSFECLNAFSMLLLYCLLFTFYLLGGYLLGIWKPEFGFLNYPPSYKYGNIHTNIVAYLSKSFITVLAILAIHFWLSFRMKNLFSTIGIGLGGVVLTIGMYISHWHSLIYVLYGLPVLMCNYAPDFHHAFTAYQKNSLIYFSIIFIASYFDFTKFFRG